LSSQKNLSNLLILDSSKNSESSNSSGENPVIKKANDFGGTVPSKSNETIKFTRRLSVHDNSFVNPNFGKEANTGSYSGLRKQISKQKSQLEHQEKPLESVDPHVIKHESIHLSSEGNEKPQKNQSSSKEEAKLKTPSFGFGSEIGKEYPLTFRKDTINSRASLIQGGDHNRPSHRSLNDAPSSQAHIPELQKTKFKDSISQIKRTTTLSVNIVPSP
jgi:hypothetical protein